MQPRMPQPSAESPPGDVKSGVSGSEDTRMVDSATIERTEPPEAMLRAAGPGRGGDLLFGATIFTAAALLFIVEPLAARMILPVLGGSPVVWITAVAFFQITLVAGYVYAHITARLAKRPRAIVQIIVIGGVLLLVPPSLPIWEAPRTDPYLWLLGLLAVAVGGPFFVLAAASPSLAHWYSSGRRRDPYFLYAVSNAGSFVGLLAYPLLIEPAFGLSLQRTLWGWAFACFVVGSVAAVAMTYRFGSDTGGALPRHAVEPGMWKQRLAWAGLAFVPSSLLLGATTFITSEIGSVPLLWVIPLAAYLLTLVVAFRDGSDRISRWPSVATAFLVFAVLTPWSMRIRLPLWPEVALHVGLLFTAGLVAHLRLYRSRPSPARLTEFYMLVSIGGALGGIFNAFVAPIIFDWALEYPIVIVIAMALLTDRAAVRLRSSRTWAPALIAGLVVFAASVGTAGASDTARAGIGLLAVAAAAVALIGAKRAVVFAVGIALIVVAFPPAIESAVVRERTFFGVLTVRDGPTFRSLYHGSTRHGVQFLDSRSDRPAAYYAPEGPLGDIFSTLPPGLNIGVVGLGVGTVAAYGTDRDRVTFYEIDAAVAEIAQDPELFTFLGDSAAQIDINIEDGRLGLERAPAGTYDLIVLDAFSADAIPVHLLTVEAIATYLDRLAPGGVAAIHLSNRYFRLEPVVSAAAEELGAAALARHDGGGPDRFASHWVVIAPDPADFGAIAALPGWGALESDPGLRLWTDDYSNLLAILK